MCRAGQGKSDANTRRGFPPRTKYTHLLQADVMLPSASALLRMYRTYPCGSPRDTCLWLSSASQTEASSGPWGEKERGRERDDGVSALPPPFITITCTTYLATDTARCSSLMSHPKSSSLVVLETEIRRRTHHITLSLSLSAVIQTLYEGMHSM